MRGFPIVGRWRIFMSTRLSRRSRPLCTETTKNSSNKGNGVEKASTNEIDVYKQLENLDFITATKILFTEPPKKKKFGLDFHLVQLFFACMPSLAVYLVAQYARYEIRKMEAVIIFPFFWKKS
ncbi:hypothetical protein Sjap_000238 [Stephania japonica]|uniref:Uncharacterized protein n=1 Tax=Stephania japonica TaxID=461633 RepID=A0AAP0KHL5_9MAGN